MDFVVALPEYKAKDVLLTTTCKATKRVALTAGASTWIAAEWAAAWIDTLLTMD